MRHIIKRIILGLLGLLILGSIVGFVLINHLTQEGSKAMFELITVDYEQTDDYYKFALDEPKATIVYYPGGLVKAESYLYQGMLLYEAGYDVIIVKMPLNLAILNREAFLDFYDDSNGPYYIAGHSLGGASAAYVARDYPDKIDGLILLAAYPPSSVDLSDKNLNVLSITASLDGVIDQDNYENTQSLLPSDTIYKTIEGGNHAQFGYYGAQRGDQEATISVENQHHTITEMITEFIDSQ